MSAKPAISTSNIADREDDYYHIFLEVLQLNFDSANTLDTNPLCTTDAEDLFETFLNHLPDDARQHYTCNACRRFVDTFGGLVTILPTGDALSVLWKDWTHDTVPPFFRAAVNAVKMRVAKARVTGMFISDKRLLGQPVTGKWHHMSVCFPPQNRVWNSKTQTAHQAMAQNNEDFKMLAAGLKEFPLPAIEQAITLLKTESLYRSEKCLGVAEWLRNLHLFIAATKNQRLRENIIWRAAALAPAHLQPKSNGRQTVTTVAIPPVTMTWKKFSETVLPTADRIEFSTPNGREGYAALLTAVHPDAPPILQWDSPERRNPVSWYVYANGGSLPSQWGLAAGFLYDVTGICLQPSMWGDKPLQHMGESVFFILKDAKDQRYENSGIALFPEILRSEFHGIRATLDAYSRAARLEGYDDASACGLRLQKGQPWDATFRVTTGPAQILYKLDRWD